MKKFITIAAMAAFAVLGTVNASAADLNATVLAELGFTPAQIAVVMDLLGSTTTSDSMLSAHDGVNLQVGVTSTRVGELQTCMNAAGFPTGKVDNEFGPNTAIGVMAFQVSTGVKPDGVVGVLSTPAFQAACPINVVVVDVETEVETEVSGFDTTGGDEASLEDFDLSSEDDAQEDSSEHVATIEFDVEDGDVMVERIDFTFTDQTSGTADNEPWDVYETLTLTVDGEEIASENIDEEDDWKEDNDPFVFRISGLDYFVEEGSEAEIEVYLTAVDNVDDITNANWDLSIDTEGIRTIDKAGITSYIGKTADVVSVKIDAEGGDEEIKIGSSNNDPDSTLLLVDEDDDSEWHEVFIFELESEENDIDLEELVIKVVTVDGDYVDLIEDVKIEIEGKEFDDFDVDVTDADAALLTFDLDKDFTVDADKSVEVTVMVEFKKADQDDDGVTDGAYDDTTIETITVSTVSVDGEGIDDVSDTGSVTSNPHSLTLTEVEITNISWDVTSSDTSGVIDFFFTVDNSDGDEDFEVVSAEVLDTATAAFVDSVAYASFSTEGTLTKVTGDTPTATPSTSYTVGDGDTTGFRVRYSSSTTGSHEVTITSVAGVEVSDNDQLSPTLILD